MKGTFKITLAYLKELGACRDGQREFQKAFPDGGEYQEVLDRCAKEGRLGFGQWLLDHIGATDDVRAYEDAVDTPDENIIFAGRVEVRLGVKIKTLISGRGIEAGCGIEAGEGILAGEGYCVFAGLCVPMSSWESLAVVTAKSKPNNLASGFWKPLEDSDEKTQ